MSTAPASTCWALIAHHRSLLSDSAGCRQRGTYETTRTWASVHLCVICYIKRWASRGRFQRHGVTRLRWRANGQTEERGANVRRCGRFSRSTLLDRLGKPVRGRDRNRIGKRLQARLRGRSLPQVQNRLNRKRPGALPERTNGIRSRYIRLDRPLSVSAGRAGHDRPGSPVSMWQGVDRHTAGSFSVRSTFGNDFGSPITDGPVRHRQGPFDCSNLMPYQSHAPCHSPSIDSPG